jgi:DNA ligase-1
MERYETICKIGTGFSDKNLQDFYEFFKNHVIKEPLAEYKVKEMKPEPDVWFDPCVVWEIKGADL